MRFIASTDLKMKIDKNKSTDRIECVSGINVYIFKATDSMFSSGSILTIYVI